MEDDEALEVDQASRPWEGYNVSFNAYVQLILISLELIFFRMHNEAYSFLMMNAVYQRGKTICQLVKIITYQGDHTNKACSFLFDLEKLCICTFSSSSPCSSFSIYFFNVLAWIFQDACGFL